VEGFAEGVIFVDITAVSGTNPVMTVILQGRSDGDSWMSYLSRRFTAITTAAIRVSNFAKNVRIRLVLEGTSPSFTTEIDGVFKN
jgi:hypothetical protein